MIYAYIRVSSDKQTVENQREAIMAAGFQIDTWLCDQAISGTVDWSRRDIKEAVNNGVEGDTIVCAELSRLGRSLKQILEIVEICQKKRIKIILLREAITIADTNPMTKLLVSILGSLAEMERNLISERTKDALALKKKQGVILGRPVGAGKGEHFKLNGKDALICEFMSLGLSKIQTAKYLGVNRMTLDFYLKSKNIEWKPVKGFDGYLYEFAES
jgi:DNA invertase Pin-like site-specific DNA recombinase